jgi:hypothetical protein
VYFTDPVSLRNGDKVVMYGAINDSVFTDVGKCDVNAMTNNPFVVNLRTFVH